MEKNYDLLLERHLEIKRIYVKLAQKYYWSGIYKDIRS
jgi:hypothetical protein